MRRRSPLRFAILVCILLSSVGADADDLRLDRENMRNILNIVAKDIEKNYHDATLGGLDWKALTEEARKKIEDAKSVSAMVTAIFSLVDKLHDSHTVFLAPQRVARPRFGFEAKPFGDEIRIYSLNPKGAAAAAGLKIGDRIVQINGFSAERNSFDLMMLYYRVLHPVLRLQVVYARGDSPPQTVLLDAKVKQGTMVEDLTNDLNLWRLIAEADETTTYFTNAFDGGIAYMQVPTFSGGHLPMPHRFDSAKAVIIDLRGNLGGNTDVLAELTGHFEAQPGTMADIVTRKKTDSIKFKPQKPNFAAPMFILVDSESASAAEMFARHFQRGRRATIIGDRTSGRVNAAQFFPEHIGTDRIIPFGLEISVGRVVFPDGEQLEKRGVTPDVQCVPTAEQLSNGHDPCLAMALTLARKAAGLPEDLPDSTRKDLAALVASMNRERESGWKD